MSCSDSSLIIAIKSKVKCVFRVANTSAIYSNIIQKIALEPR